MTSNFALDLVRPAALAQLAAELIADHAEEVGPDSYNFRTETAKNAYSELLAAGIANCGEDTFFGLISEAREYEAHWADDLPF